MRLAPLLGAIGIGGIAVALAAQSILSNFIASVLLQTRRPFRRGDQIATNDHEGRVEDVNLRAVVLRSFDGEQVVLPAAAVVASPIVNYTRLGRRRTTLTVGVGYATDLRSAQKVIVDAVRRVDDVHPSPPPEALVQELGESSIDLAVRFWHAPEVATMWRVRSEVAIEVKAALDDAGIEIPFPQRVLWPASPPTGVGGEPGDREHSD
ncbi:MAG TPA: mechanosensitive ion channel family protein [Acidimicrobiales bacterium]|nr:mechanosensitive ion channel family protein [Acidimicrobiales bacterium]